MNYVYMGYKLFFVSSHTFRIKKLWVNENTKMRRKVKIIRSTIIFQAFKYITNNLRKYNKGKKKNDNKDMQMQTKRSIFLNYHIKRKCALNTIKIIYYLY